MMQSTFPVKQAQLTMLNSLVKGKSVSSIQDLYFLTSLPLFYRGSKISELFQRLLRVEPCLRIKLVGELDALQQKLGELNEFSPVHLGGSSCRKKSLRLAADFIEGTRPACAAGYLNTSLTRMFSIDEPEEVIVGFCVSHLICDGTGIKNVKRKLIKIINGEEPEICTTDGIPTFLRRCQDEAHAQYADAKYWRNCLSDHAKSPFEYPIPTKTPRSFEWSISKQCCQTISYAFMRHRCSFQIGLMACYAQSLMKVLERDKIIIRSVYANRRGAECACSGFYTSAYAAVFERGERIDLALQSAHEILGAVKKNIGTFKAWDMATTSPRTTDFQFIPNGEESGEIPIRIIRRSPPMQNIVSLWSTITGQQGARLRLVVNDGFPCFGRLKAEILDYLANVKNL
jgi:hypothetical protein